LQYLVVEQLRQRYPLDRYTIHHFSPERGLDEHFRSVFKLYLSAGLGNVPVDCPVDLTELPFEDGSCDFIFASHVLEHIEDDRRAIEEIRRVLRPGGMAVLPVPIVQEVTVEYAEPNQHESLHVRAPGLDYFDKYRSVFSRVEVYGSEDFDPKYQLWNYEDRSNYPTLKSPLRQPMPGKRHPDYVPVCFA
jgi:SAM-dependent methyltransferase